MPRPPHERPPHPMHHERAPHEEILERLDRIESILARIEEKN